LSAECQKPSKIFDHLSPQIAKSAETNFEQIMLPIFDGRKATNFTQSLIFNNVGKLSEIWQSLLTYTNRLPAAPIQFLLPICCQIDRACRSCLVSLANLLAQHVSRFYRQILNLMWKSDRICCQFVSKLLVIMLYFVIWVIFCFLQPSFFLVSQNHIYYILPFSCSQSLYFSYMFLYVPVTPSLPSLYRSCMFLLLP